MALIKTIIYNKGLLIVLLGALILRFTNLDFPLFSVEEAQIASRANFLVTQGSDELGRKFPLIFNSSTDYELPVTTYITALGILIFGKNDLGARISFILIGVFISLLISLIAKILFKDENIAVLASLIAAFSPGLIFFSKIPNDYIILTALILILVFLLLQKSVPKLFTASIIILMLLTSKISWFITMPTILLILFLRSDLSRKEKINLILLGSILIFIMIFIFLNIPQGRRSLMENNFSVFSDISIKNGIDRLRGQQIDGWPIFLDRILLNKSFLAIAGIFHWLSYLQPSFLFGQLDSNGKFGFLNQGGLPKIVIMPFLVGLIFLIKKRSKKLSIIFLFTLFLSAPTIFIYPKVEVGTSILILPFLILISSLGLRGFSYPFTKIIIIIVAAEAIINSFFVLANIKNTNIDRPIWIKQVVNEAYTYSQEAQVFLSDKIAPDLAPFIFWYTIAIPQTSSVDNYPYRINQRNLGQIKIFNSDNISYSCIDNEINYFFLTESESTIFIEGVEGSPNLDTRVEKIYQDSFNQDTVYLIKSPVCLKNE